MVFRLIKNIHQLPLFTNTMATFKLDYRLYIYGQCNYKSSTTHIKFVVSCSKGMFLFLYLNFCSWIVSRHINCSPMLHEVWWTVDKNGTMTLSTTTFSLITPSMTFINKLCCFVKSEINERIAMRWTKLASTRRRTVFISIV
jgi:hypothetical protein